MDTSESQDSCSLHQASRNGKDTREDSKILPAARPSIEGAAPIASGLPLLESSNMVDVSEVSKEKKDTQSSSAVMLNLVKGGNENDGEEKDIPEEELTASDVLTSGRKGGSYMSHAGNKKFRAFVHSHATEYALALKENKVKVVRKVVDNVKTKGGRFLTLDKGTKMWHKMSDEEVICKTRQALYHVAGVLEKSTDLERNLREQPSVLDKDLRNSDVLCAGQGLVAHPGNKNFIALIHASIIEYKNASDEQKKDVAVNVVNEIIASKGRFLEQDRATGIWHILDLERASKRAGRALYFASMHASKKAEDETISQEQKGNLAKDLTVADVLTSGKTGLGNMFHAGNNMFRALVRSHASEYKVGRNKAGVVRKVVDTIRSRGGRFLKKVEVTNVWHPMSDKQVIKKTRDALNISTRAIEKQQDLERNPRERPSGKASPVKKRQHGGTTDGIPQRHRTTILQIGHVLLVEDEPPSIEKRGSKRKAAAELNSSQQRPVIKTGVVFSKKRVGRSDTVARDTSSLGDVDDTDTVSGNERRDQENGQACQNISHSGGDDDTKMNGAPLVYPDGVVSSSGDVADNENKHLYEGNDQACQDTSHLGNEDDEEMNDAPLVSPDGVVSSCEDVATGTADYVSQQQYPFLQLFFGTEDA